MQNNSSLRVLLITHFLPPSHTAGTEQYTLGLGKALKAKGHDVHIVCAEDWEIGKKYWNGVTNEVFEGLIVHRVHLNWTKAADPNQILYDSLPVERWLDRFLQTNNFNLVHVTSTYSLGVGVFRSVKRANLPLVLTLMDFWFLCPSLQLLQSDGSLCNGRTTAWQCQSCLMAGSNLFQRWKKFAIPDSVNARIWGTLAHAAQITHNRGFRGFLLNMNERKKILQESINLPDLVISPSRIVKEMFSINSPRHVELVPYGHDLAWVEEYTGKSNSDIIRFGYLGQIQKIKGVHLIIDAFMKANFNVPALLNIWGDYTRNKTYSQELEAAIGENKSIILRGKYDRRQLAKIMSEIDVVIAPSMWYENAPLVIQEAFATKTPVITTNLGGMSEAVHHEINGLLFLRGDVGDLSRQMQRIVNEPRLLEQLVEGIPVVKSFENELMELETIYRRLVEKKPAFIEQSV